jgi:hypothetical protein
MGQRRAIRTGRSFPSGLSVIKPFLPSKIFIVKITLLSSSSRHHILSHPRSNLSLILSRHYLSPSCPRNKPSSISSSHHTWLHLRCNHHQISSNHHSPFCTRSSHHQFHPIIIRPLIHGATHHQIRPINNIIFSSVTAIHNQKDLQYRKTRASIGHNQSDFEEGMASMQELSTVIQSSRKSTAE